MADYRYIRRAFLGSRRIKQLDWKQECFFIRLMLTADDYGLFEADPALLRATLFPQHLDIITENDIEDCLRACIRAELIFLYENTGHQYGMIYRFGQRHMSAPKFPLPPFYTATKVSNTRWDFTEIPAKSPPPTETHGDAPRTDKTHRDTQSTTETHGDSRSTTETLGLYDNIRSGHGSENSSPAIAPERETLVDTREGEGDETRFREWLTALMQAHPASKRARKLTPDAQQEARDAFDRIPEANEYASLLTEYFNADTDNGFFKPKAVSTFFRRLESTIDNALQWQKKAQSPEGFTRWLTPLLNAHPSLQKTTALSKEVYVAALDAYKRLPDAPQHADRVQAYYLSRVTQDKHRRDYFKPLDGGVYFQKLENILTNAEAWARFTEWKSPSEAHSHGTKTTSATAPQLSEEEVSTFISDLRSML